jgi:hypothetical protein
MGLEAGAFGALAAPFSRPPGMRPGLRLTGHTDDRLLGE